MSASFPVHLYFPFHGRCNNVSNVGAQMLKVLLQANLSKLFQHFLSTGIEEHTGKVPLKLLVDEGGSSEVFPRCIAISECCGLFSLKLQKYEPGYWLR